MLAAEGWHPGVIGIVAARIAERHYRPTVLIALDGDEGSGSGRSIPGFDLLAGLTAGSDELLRYGGHRAAAGLTIARNRVDAFREAFVTHAARHAHPRGPRRHASASTPSPPATPSASSSPRSSSASSRSGWATPPSPCSSPPPCSTTRARWGRAATSRSPSPPAEPAPAASSSAPAAPCPCEPGEPVDAAVKLEVNRYNGATEPRLILRSVQRCAAPIDVIGEPDWKTGFERELTRDRHGGHRRRDPTRGTRRPRTESVVDPRAGARRR